MSHQHGHVNEGLRAWDVFMQRRPEMIVADTLLHDIRKQPPHAHAHAHTHILFCSSFSLLLPWLQTGEIILSATKNTHLSCRKESWTVPSLLTLIKLSKNHIPSDQ